MARSSTSFGVNGRVGGRKPGRPNKFSADLREYFLLVFDELQESEDFSLRMWAEENLTDFYKIIAKLLPQEFKGEFRQVIKVSVKEDIPGALPEAEEEKENNGNGYSHLSDFG